MPQVPARRLRSWTMASAGALSVVCAGAVGAFASVGHSASASTAGAQGEAVMQRASTGTSGSPRADRREQAPVSTSTPEPGQPTWATSRGVTATPAHTSPRTQTTSSTRSSPVAVAALTTKPTPAVPVDVYFVPHPDDEILSMGAAIRRSVTLGHDVHVVLVTDGASPGGTTVAWVNERLQREGRPPLREGATMAAARAAEFLTATQRLGVKRANIHLAGEPDATLTKASATGVIAQWAQRYPEATLTTMSWLDIHSDHYTLGYALDQYCLDHDRGGCRFTQFQRFVRDSLAPSAFPVASPPGQWVQCDNQVRSAANEYRRWNPRQGRFAIGWLYSVPSQFAYLSHNCRSWVHGTSATWDDAEERYAAQEWARTHQVPRKHAKAGGQAHSD